MPRIKKRGLDYFPMNTDFIHNRLVRRIMKQKGDATLSVLVGALSFIYAGEGYYVYADSFFYEDLSTNLYEKTTEEVKEIISLAVEYGIFDASLFSKYSILTSVDIQRQYLFSTKRRSTSHLAAEYCLLNDGELVLPKDADNETVSTCNEKESKDKCNINTPTEGENVTSGTHSIAQHNIAQHSVAKNKEEYLPHPPTVGQEEKRGDGEEGGDSFSSKATQPKRKEWTTRMIDELTPPATDGLPRNYEGLLHNLRSFSIPPNEQYAIIMKSNFGMIGHPVWKGFVTLREANGKIKLPGRYLLSILNKHTHAGAQKQVAIK